MARPRSFPLGMEGSTAFKLFIVFPPKWKPLPVRQGLGSDKLLPFPRRSPRPPSSPLPSTLQAFRLARWIHLSHFCFLVQPRDATETNSYRAHIESVSAMQSICLRRRGGILRAHLNFSVLSVLLFHLSLSAPADLSQPPAIGWLWTLARGVESRCLALGLGMGGWDHVIGSTRFAAPKTAVTLFNILGLFFLLFLLFVRVLPLPHGRGFSATIYPRIHWISLWRLIGALGAIYRYQQTRLWILSPYF